MQFGLLLPHFGAHANRRLLLAAASRAEEFGFDALYVRDHLVWHPHGFEGQDPTFIDPFVALAAAGAVTERIKLGTAVIIPTRWPLKLAQDLASLAWLVGADRVIAGIGLGFDPKEFAANGFRQEDREAIMTETVEICRLVWQEQEASYSGTLFRFDGITIAPQPSRMIPFQYGGTSPAGVRRAVKYTEGWQGARLPLKTLDKRLALARKEEEALGRPRLHTSVQPLVTIADRYDDAARRVPISEMGGGSESAKWYDLPPSGKFETIQDLEGLNIVGTPEQVVHELRKLESRVDEVIIDLRLQLDDFEHALEMIGKEVLPHFPRKAR